MDVRLKTTVKLSQGIIHHDVLQPKMPRNTPVDEKVVLLHVASRKDILHGGLWEHLHRKETIIGFGLWLGDVRESVSR